MPVSLRDRLGVPETCGPALNPLPFRARVDLTGSFATLVGRVQAELAGLLEHSPLPFEEIAAACDVLRGPPLPIQFIGQAALPSGAGPGLRVGRELQQREGRSPGGLLAGVRIGPEEIAIEFEYRCDMLASGEAAALLRSFRLLLAGLCAAAERPVGAARMLQWTEIRRALEVRPGQAPDDAPAWLHAGIHAGARRIEHDHVGGK